MLINNKSLIKTINKLNLTDDEREKFNKISEDDKGNFLYNGKPVAGGATNYIICNNIEEMKNLSVTTEGTIIRTLGYYSISDGGEAEYLIRSKESYINDEVFDITLNNGTIAQRILANNKVNVLSLGIKKNSNKSDDIIYASNKLKKMFETYDKLYTAYFPSGDYYIHGINLDDDKHSSGRKISLEGEKTSDSNATWNVFIYTRGNDFLTTTNSEQDYITVKYISFHGDNLAPDGTTLTKKGKCFSSEFANEFNFNLTGVRFANFEYGWYCTKYACTGSYAKDLTLYANKYGIYIPMATHGLKIEGVHCHYNMTALYLPAGGTENIIKGFNYSPGYLSVDKDDYNEYIGIYTQGSLTIDGMYLEDYLGTQVSPEKSIAIDYNCSGSSKLCINSGLFINYAAAMGEKVIRYRGNYGSNNLILTNPVMDKNSIDMFAFESGKVVTGIVIDGKESVIYSNKMYINNFPPEKHFIASKIRTSQSMNVTYNSTTYQCFEIPMCYGDLRNKSIIIGAENLQDDGRYLPTVGNWLSLFPSYMKIKGYFKISGYNFDGKMKLFIFTSTGTDGFKCIEFTVNNGKAIIPIDETIDYYKFEENTSNNFIISFYMGTTIGDGNTLSFPSFTDGTSYDIEFITPDDKHYQ